MSDVNITTTTTTTAGRSRLGGRWIDDWRPEDGEFWNTIGTAIARRNLIYSVSQRAHRVLDLEHLVCARALSWPPLRL